MSVGVYLCLLGDDHKNVSSDHFKYFFSFNLLEMVYLVHCFAWEWLICRICWAVVDAARKSSLIVTSSLHVFKVWFLDPLGVVKMRYSLFLSPSRVQLTTGTGGRHISLQPVLPKHHWRFQMAPPQRGQTRLQKRDRWGQIQTANRQMKSLISYSSTRIVWIPSKNGISSGNALIDDRFDSNSEQTSYS